MKMDAAVPVLIWSCVLAAPAVPALIGVKLFRNSVADRPSPVVVLKAAVTLVLWFTLTAGLFANWAMLAYVVPHALSSHPSAEWHPTPAYIGVHVGYLLIGGGMVCWVWRRGRVKLP